MGVVQHWDRLPREIRESHSWVWYDLSMKRIGSESGLDACPVTRRWMQRDGAVLAARGGWDFVQSHFKFWNRSTAKFPVAAGTS